MRAGCIAGLLSGQRWRLHNPLGCTPATVLICENAGVAMEISLCFSQRRIPRFLLWLKHQDNPMHTLSA